MEKRTVIFFGTIFVLVVSIFGYLVLYLPFIEAGKGGTSDVNLTVYPSLSIKSPKNFSISRTDDNENVVLNWSIVQDAEGYMIWYSSNLSEMLNLNEGNVDSEGANVVIEDPSKLSWIDSSSNIYKKKYYRLASYKGEEINLNDDVVGKYDIEFVKGWNLISLPFQKKDNSLGNVFGNRFTGAESSTKADTFVKWNKNTQSWESAWLLDGTGDPSYDGKWYTGYYQTDLKFNFKEGGWIHIRPSHKEVNLTFTGEVNTENITIEVVSPWTMAGSPFIGSVHLDNSSLYESGATGAESSTKADTFVKWNKNTQSWESAWLLDGTGDPSYDGKWYTGYYPTKLEIETADGFWLNAKEPFNWSFSIK